MIRKTFAPLLAAAFVFVLASAAAAQYETRDTSVIGIRATIFKPTGDDLNSINSTWFSPMIDWNIKFDQFDRPSLVCSFGWFGDSNSERDGFVTVTKEAKVAPLTLTTYRHFGQPGAGKDWYVGGGVGMYWASFKGRHRVYDVDDSVVAPGIQLVTGYEIGPWFAEFNLAKVKPMSAPGSDIDFSSWGISLGSRYTF